jgi:hypothetical protein
MNAGMAKKFDAHGAAARAWSLALLGLAVALFALSAVLLWSPYDRRQDDLQEPGVSERQTVAGQDFEAESPAASSPAASSPAAPSPAASALSETPPDAASGAVRQRSTQAVIELDLQPVAGPLRAPVIEALSTDDPVFRPASRDAGGSENGRARVGSGEGVTTTEADAGAQSVAFRNPAAGQGGAGGPLQEGLGAQPVLERCGMVDCPLGSVCCNASCGICALPGETCSRFTCSMPRFPISVTCGRNTCSAGEVCCNMSCGICAAPGEACSQQACD